MARRVLPVGLLFASLPVLLLGVVAPAAAVRAPSAATPPPCKTPRIVVWLDTRGDGAAGSVYYHLEFTNLSGRTCRLRGFPGVSAVGLAGQRIGAAASRRPEGAHTVDLRHGATAAAVLRIVQVGNFPESRCRPVTAAGLRVYPPGNRVSKVVPFPLRACSRSGVAFLSVGAAKRA